MFTKRSLWSELGVLLGVIWMPPGEWRFKVKGEETQFDQIRHGD